MSNPLDNVLTAIEHIKKQYGELSDATHKTSGVIAKQLGDLGKGLAYKPYEPKGGE